MKIYILLKDHKNAFGEVVTDVKGVATSLKHAQNMADGQLRMWRQLGPDLWDDYGRWSVVARDLQTEEFTDTWCGYCFSDDAVSCMYLADQHYGRKHDKDIACVCYCHAEEDPNETY